jgi:hypothetical protein
MLSLLLFAAACSRSSEEAQAPPAPAAAPRAAPAAAPPNRKAPDCARVAPKTMMEKHCPQCVLTERKSPDGRGVSCRYKGESIGGEFEIMLACDEDLAKGPVIEESLRQFESLKSMKYERIEGLGRGAVKNGDLQVVFWDDDTSCQATLTGVMVKVDLAAVARDLAAAITPAALE